MDQKCNECRTILTDFNTCLTCYKSVCTRCESIHRLTYNTHIFTLENRNYNKCAVHSYHTSHYCLTCKKPACESCVKNEHNHHETRYLNLISRDVAAETKKLVGSRLAKVQAEKENMKRQIDVYKNLWSQYKPYVKSIISFLEEEQQHINVVIGQTKNLLKYGNHKDIDKFLDDFDNVLIMQTINCELENQLRSIFSEDDPSSLVLRYERFCEDLNKIRILDLINTEIPKLCITYEKPTREEVDNVLFRIRIGEEACKTDKIGTTNAQKISDDRELLNLRQIVKNKDEEIRLQMELLYSNRKRDKSIPITKQPPISRSIQQLYSETWPLYELKVALMLDESLDIATNKKLVMFCKIVYDNKVKIEFCANITISNGNAETIYNCLMDWLRDVGINRNKVSGLGSDGAAVMVGQRSGLGVRLQARNAKIIHVWCAAHKLALVSYWAANRVPYLQTVNEMLIAIFNFYQYSAPRYAKVRELQKLMGQKVKRFKKPTQVRWLSMSDAVKACLSFYSALILSLEHEVASAPNSEGGNKARGILKKIKCFKFLSALCLLRDILDLLDRTSKNFQKDKLDIHQMKSLIIATKDTILSYRPHNVQPPVVDDMIQKTDENSNYSGIPITCSLNDRRIFNNMKAEFIDQLVQEFSNRFSDNDLGILNDLKNLFNPKKTSSGKCSH